MSLHFDLLSLPLWLALFVTLVAAILPPVLIFWLVRHYFPVSLRRAHTEVAGFVFATVGVIYGVLLAFIVVVVWGQWEDTKENVRDEAAAAGSLYHAMGMYSKSDAAPDLRSLVVAYLREVVDNEFPLMAEGGLPPRTSAALKGLWVALETLKPVSSREQVIFSEMVSKLTALESLRAYRLDDAEEQLPLVVWLALYAGAVLTVGFALFLGTENERAHAAMIAMLAALIGLAIYVTIELDLPFIGESSIGPKRFLEVMSAISGG